MASFRAPRVSRRTAAVSLLVVLITAFAIPLAARPIVAWRLGRAGAARELDLRWTTLDVRWPARVSITGLLATDRARGDTVALAESLDVTLAPLSLLRLRPAARRIEVFHARLAARHGRTDPDTLAPEGETGEGKRDHSEKLKRAAASLVRALLLPARRMPRLELRDVTVSGAATEGPAPTIGIAWLELEPRRDGARLAGAGRLALERAVPFEFALHYGNDDRLTGGARFAIPDPGRARPVPLLFAVDGAVHQDRRAGVLTVADSSRLTLGQIPIWLSGALSARGPSLSLRLACDGVSEDAVRASVPRPALGPLADLEVRGSWDYRLAFRLDLASPDSVDFSADVTPHGLAIDAVSSRLDLLSIEDPFVATIHLPRGQLVTRDLSPANPHFRPLERIDSLLVYAVITNEDGGFFRHRGFNLEAVKGAIADNIRAGAYRRGAGTITMQLARNLWLGHDRTLSRKAQEVILAWALEHLTYLTKRRLLEIYLNIIEWGPDVHGADEAARYYFARDAEHLSVDEALFLTTVIPAPKKWRYRVDADGALRPFERAQMHFIGRAMIAKGWLSPGDLPPSESLRIELRGPARGVLFPRGEAAADTVPA